jgi:hypothetical protein
MLFLIEQRDDPLLASAGIKIFGSVGGSPSIAFLYNLAISKHEAIAAISPMSSKKGNFRRDWKAQLRIDLIQPHPVEKENGIVASDEVMSLGGNVKPPSHLFNDANALCLIDIP